jgi:hypothetical protein
MAKQVKKGPAFLLKTYDMIQVLNLYMLRVKNSSKLSLGTIRASDFS